MLARFVLGAVAAGAMIAPGLAGQVMSGEEARKFVAGKVFAFKLFRRHPRRGTHSRRWRRDGRGAIFGLRTRAPSASARQYASGSRPGRMCLAQGPSVRAVLQSRQAGRTHFPWLGLGHGLCVLRFPSSSRGIDADGAGDGPAAFTASVRARRSNRPCRNPASRKSQDRAGEFGKHAGIASFDGLTAQLGRSAFCVPLAATRLACGAYFSAISPYGSLPRSLSPVSKAGVARYVNYR